ncbi:hypothetical protein TRVL_04399 [Trypanosoma vivax]|nr:hypothetical protein TRVL_04399 [Trypanosoma vivax]
MVKMILLKLFENVVEQQRVQWVSSYYENKPKESRRILSSEQVRRARESSLVPNKLHVEECLLVILRDQSCFEPISSSVRESASSLLKCKEISPADAGLKVFVAPSPQNQVRLSAHSSPATYSHETPKRLNFVGTPTTENVCVNNCKLSTYEARCQSRPSEDSTAWLSPSFQPEERRQCSPNLLFRQSNAEPVFDMQQTPLNWNTVFMPPGYMASPSYGSRASRSVERMATPSTAPRRVTFLKGDKKTRRSDADTLMRNLFPNNLSPNNDDPSGNVVYSCTPMEGVCVREQKEREKEAKQIASNCAQQINFTE